jgi:hypothetical protein
VEQEPPTLPQHLSSPPYFSGVHVILWRVWRYQRGNQNPYIEEEQTTQWPKEKVQKDKQRSTKHTLYLVFHVVFCRSMFDLFVLATVLYVLLWFTDSYLVSSNSSYIPNTALKISLMIFESLNEKKIFRFFSDISFSLCITYTQKNVKKTNN